MLTLPIPLFVAAVLGFLLVRVWSHRQHAPILLWLVGVCAAQSVVIALVQHYGIVELRWLQALLASTIAPLAWLAFEDSRQSKVLAARHAWHLAAPLLVTVCLLGPRAWLDLVIPLTFLGYGLALLLALRRGGDTLVRTRLASGELPLRLWRLTAVSLLVSAASDVGIVIAQVLGMGHWQGVIISIASSLTLLLVGSIALSDDLHHPGREAGDEADIRVDRTGPAQGLAQRLAQDSAYDQAEPAGHSRPVSLTADAAIDAHTDFDASALPMPGLSVPTGARPSPAELSAAGASVATTAATTAQKHSLETAAVATGTAARPDALTAAAETMDTATATPVTALSARPATTATETTQPDKRVTAQDLQTMQAVHQRITEQKLFLDPDLTLNRLARKAGIPAKQLSTVINRCQGENVSKYINRFRIEHACTLLASGQPVTATAFASGFNTKSNFNREFQRIHALSPSRWQAENPQVTT